MCSVCCVVKLKSFITDADTFRRLASSGHKGYTQLYYYSLPYLYFSKLVSFGYVPVTKLIA